MGLLVLLSAMHLKDHGILNTLNIKCDAIIINQCDRSEEQRITDEDGRRILFYSTKDRGLSKSRNLAVEKAFDPFFDRDDICMFCDNDCVYEDDASDAISEFYSGHRDADLGVFFIKRPERQHPVRSSVSLLGYTGAMKIFSPEISFRKESLRLHKSLRMDERFGAGAFYGMGEENIFLFDAIRSGLRVFYVPKQTAHLMDTESTWFSGYTDSFFIDRGAGYLRMSRPLHGLLNLQFALRKRGLYKADNSFLNALSCMDKGANGFAKERIFVVGDHLTGTGPANATARLLEALPYDTLCQRCSKKLPRLLELFAKIPSAGILLLSGHSKQNLWALKIAGFFRIPVWFWMHGAVEHENAINGEEDEDMTCVERRVLGECERILAVSPSFEEWLKTAYPEYREKIFCLPNGVDNLGLTLRKDSDANTPATRGQGPLRILSVGGGMIRKRIIKIAAAVELLRKRGLDATLTVIGKPGGDSGLLKGFDCVMDRGLVSEDEAFRLMSESDIFVQNSCFETFGLAPLEALSAGCSLLLSKHIGALCVFDPADIEDGDVINDCEDENEIADKLAFLADNPNRQRLSSGLDMEKHCWRSSAHVLIDMVHSRRS